MSYGNDSIIALEGADTIRLKPASILGADNLEGAFHTFKEILANAIDEAREGYGDTIKVIKHKDYSLSVIDRGRGCPVDWSETAQKYNYELVFMTLYASGKYKTNEGENYEYSLGTNGLGATATQYTSKFMDVEVVRDGYKYELHFEKGNLIGKMKKTPSTDHTGTSIHWLPDDEVFMEINIPQSYIKDLLKRQAIINKGIKFIFEDEENNIVDEYYYENGIIDYINEISENKEFTDILTLFKEVKGKDREDKPEYKVKFEIAFCFNNYNNLVEYYHNSSWLEYGGSPDRAVKTAMISAIDKYLKDTSKYNKNEKKIIWDDIEDSLILIVNSHSTMTSYENQTKKAITNKFIQEAITGALKDYLEVYFLENKDVAEKIAQQILINKRSREKSNDNRQKIKKELESQISNVATRPSKYVPCRSKDRNKKRLILIEGDSALNAVKQSRDSDFDAIFPLKGKPINCLKKTIDEIMNNEEVKNIVKLIGGGITYKGKSVKGLPKFDINKIEFSEVDILSDADEDGYHIRCLLIGMFYMLMPDMIKYGKIKILEAPLYRIIQGDKEYLAYNEIERGKILTDIKGKYLETRFKGLGGLNAQLMARTVMDIENRRAKVITLEDVEESIKMLETFLDDDSTDRKRIIEEEGYRYFDYSAYED